VFSNNADVKPTFLVDGFVAGTWNLTRRNGAATIELRPFGRLPRPERDRLESEAHRVLGHLSAHAGERTVRFGR
jgi:hypothetical protein